MSCLFYTSAPAHAVPIPRLAAEQVNCGPFLEETWVGGRVLSLRVPKGIFDLASMFAKMPIDQLPEAFVVLADSAEVHRPRNLAFLPCPKVLLVGNAIRKGTQLASLVEYIASERFDRVVVVCGRRQYSLLHAVGVKNLFWFPGLLFPHGDEVVRAARQQERQDRIAMVGSVDRRRSRRLTLAGLLAREGLPLDLRAVGPMDVLGFYGSSLIAFDADGQGDFTLRTFIALASGTMLLSERTSAQGSHGMWREAQEWVTYGSPAELIERAKYFIDDPSEARRIGERGARWFADHFGEKRRRAAFEGIAFNGKAVPEFKIAAAAAVSIAGDPRRTSSVFTVYDEARALHCAQEAVRIACDETLPLDIERVFCGMKRVQLLKAEAGDEARPAADVDLHVVSRTRNFLSEAAVAKRLWIWDAVPEDYAAVHNAFVGAGYRAPVPNVCYFVRQAVKANVAADPIAEQARQCLDAGETAKALDLATQALKTNPSSVEGYFVASEIALEKGDQDLMAALLEKARVLAPDDPRSSLLGLPTLRTQTGARETRRLLALGWEAVGELEGTTALACAQAVLRKKSSLAEAHHLGGCAGLVLARHRRDFMMHGRALQALELACKAAPGRPDLWHEFAVAARVAGGTVAKSIPAFREAVRLDPESATDWFGLGEALLSMDQSDAAADAFRQALKCVPNSLGFVRWLGNALKKQGRLDEALAAHVRGVGRRGAPATVKPLRHPGRRRVVFVVQNGHSWPCMASVHAAFSGDPEWEVVVVGLPWMHPSFAHSSTKDQNRVFDFLTEKNIPFVHWEKFPLKDRPADLVFLQNPYDSTRPDGWKVGDLVRAGHRLCYVPYAVEFGGDRDDVLYQFNMPLQQMAYAVFARSQAHRRLFAEHCIAGDRHVIVTGHPKFDDLSRQDAVAPDPEMIAFAAGRPLVLWSPHFDVKLNGTRFCDGYSTFMRWHEFILEEFARRPELAFVVRPHPTFFSAMEERGLMSRAELDAFVGRCSGTGNVLLHRKPDYFPLLMATDVLVSDASSLLLEFGVSGKPVCYLHNPCGPVAQAAYELDLDYIRERFTWATTEVQIRAFLDGIPDAILDEAGREGRALDLRRRMGVRPDGIGVAVKRALEERLAVRPKAPQAVAV